jgi:peptidoglycan/LPS O-acetylase OafA/YrhL
MQLAAKRPAGARPRSAGPPVDRARVAVAVLSLAAGYVHLAYVQSHWAEWWAYGAFFLAAGAGQLVYAPLLLRWPRPAVRLAGLAGNLAIVAMYFLSRTEGPPLGPHGHAIEPAGPVDLTTTAAEVAIVLILLAGMGRTARRWTVDALLVVGLAAWVLRLTGHLA